MKLPPVEIPIAEQHQEEPSLIKVEWKKVWGSNDEQHCDIKLGSSHYSAFLANGVFFDGFLRVPPEERRKGIGTKLLCKLIEIAKERSVNEIFHNIQSLEGLMIVTKKLKQPNRKYYFKMDKEISFSEAKEILQRKAEEGRQTDTRIWVGSSTYIDQLEQDRNTPL